MSITFGFFNSKNGDRKYTAEQMSSLFAGIIKDGVFEDYPAQGNRLKVSGDPNAAYTVNVGVGRAWFKNVWVDVDANVPLTVAQDPTLPRRSAIVLEIHKHATGDNARSARLIVIDGTPAANPAIPARTKDDSTGIYQYMLAWVEVPAGTNSWDHKYTANDTKIHNVVGVNSDVPFIIGAVQSVTAANVLAEWREAVYNRIDEDLEEYLDDDGSALYAFLSSRFDSIDSYLASPTAHFNKVYYYYERESTDSGTYYGTLPRYRGGIGTISSRSDSAGGMEGALSPANSTVLVNDILIGSSGVVAIITDITRNATTNNLQTISVRTLGSLNTVLEAAVTNLTTNLNQLGNTVSTLQEDHDRIAERSDNFFTAPTAYFDKVFYYHEREDSPDNTSYYGVLSPTRFATSVIRSKNTAQGGLSNALQPYHNTVLVGDILIGSSGVVAVVTDIVRHNVTNRITEIETETVGSILGYVSGAIDTLQEDHDRIAERSDAFFAAPTAYFDKVFYYYEREDSPDNTAYYGVLSPTRFATSVIRSKNSEQGGMPNALQPYHNAVRVGDVLIGSSGVVATVTDIVRHNVSGRITEIETQTVGSILGYVSGSLQNLSGAIDTLRDDVEDEFTILEQNLSHDIATVDSHVDTVQDDLNAIDNTLRGYISDLRSDMEAADTDLNDHLGEVYDATQMLATRSVVYHYNGSFGEIVGSEGYISAPVITDRVDLGKIVPALPLTTGVFNTNIALPKAGDQIVDNLGMVATVSTVSYTWQTVEGSGGAKVIQAASIAINIVTTIRPRLEVMFNLGGGAGRPFCNKTFAEIKAAYEHGIDISCVYMLWDNSTSPNTYSECSGLQRMVCTTTDLDILSAVEFEWTGIYYGASNPADRVEKKYVFRYDANELTVTGTSV